MHERPPPGSRPPPPAREFEDAASQLEYPTCPFCKSDRRELRFGFSPPYRLARCLGCSAYHLYPRLSENDMQQLYRKSTYFEGGTSGYSDTSYPEQESALRATFRRLMQTLRDRGLQGAISWRLVAVTDTSSMRRALSFVAGLGLSFPRKRRREHEPPKPKFSSAASNSFRRIQGSIASSQRR